ncbi:LPS export ABC transporter periplasmic protein LptC [Gayadomonas joobiniege]|uniref:LPS export ABC transporter periplasmic protein LptC n=1 Tax=Gayadomonas joobiniege TaxID=1234606 RepID=UPI00036053C1|nr:LPS export ABC transporter periplasmic protein LptC [Gayadomonas joobiniege]
MKQLLLSVVIIIAISQYFWRSWSEPQQEQNRQEEVVQPDYKLEKLTRREYSESGTPLRQLSAASLEHYQELKFTYFKKPVYFLYSQQQKDNWQISSDESVIYENNKLELEGNVQVAAQTPTPWFDTLYVKRLVIDLNNQKISTTSEVKGTAQRLTFTGQGLTGDLKTKEFELKNNVKAQYSVE